MNNSNNSEKPKSQNETKILTMVIFVGIISILRPNLHTLYFNDNTTSSNLISYKNKSAPIQKEPALNNGIDVSHFQGEINWTEVIEQKIDFVFLKSTQGNNFIDPTYQQHKSELEQLNIPFGSYHFFEPDIDPIHQANFYLEKTGTNHKLPPVVDIEITGDVSSTEIQTRLKAWLEKIEKETQCKPIIYTNRYFWNEYLNADFTEYYLWISDYAKEITLPQNVDDWLLWQNSQSFKLQGIQNSVDHDTFNEKSMLKNNIFCSH